MPSRCRFATLLIAVAGLTALAACKSPQELPNAQIPNTVDTVTLYALNGTPVGTPSAYALIGPKVVDVGVPPPVFDFAFNIDGDPVLMPSGTFPGLPNVAGLQRATSPTFGLILTAPIDGYVIDKPLVIGPEALVLMRSATFLCADGTNHSLYGKLHVLDISVTARTVRFEVMVDQNCGYLSLAPGLPVQ
jgi:hypothetical protein